MKDLTNLNTLRVPAKAKDFREIREVGEIREIGGKEPYIFLGDGANILFTKDFPGTVIKINLLGKKIISENDDEVIIEVAAGENWHEFVTWAVDHNYSGIENMALIPGTVGAAVVGNIGAYGQEVRSTIVGVRCSVLGIQEPKLFNNAECEFAYRESFFKHHREYLVTAAQFRLKKNYDPRPSYEQTIQTRIGKLPDWNKLGTAGSFFKNPIISGARYSVLGIQIKDLQKYPTKDSNLFKIPAGKLLDVLGWKGKKIGNVSTHDKSALVIVNLGGATGKEIFDYAEMMRADVKKNFGINLEYEVRII